MHNRSLSNYRSNAKSVASATVFFVSSIFAINLPNLSAAEQSLSLSDRVKHLEELNQTRNKVQADISYQLSEIQREVRLLTGQVEDNSFKLKQIQDRQRDLYRDIENRLSGLTSQSNGSGQAKANNSSTPTVANSGNSKPANTAIDRTANREFEAAFALVRSKDFTSAITALDEFLTKHPKSVYSDNARYWLGQVHLVQGNQDQAVNQFLSLISEFPDSTKRSAAQVKLGDIYVKQAQWEKAKEQYNAALKTSSGTYKQLAQKGLDKIRQAGK
jgi:tol-pal system protein YbgF